jgi:hypothetical protein
MAEGLHPVLNSFPWTAKEQKEKDKVLYMLAALALPLPAWAPQSSRASIPCRFIDFFRNATGPV